MLNVEFTIHCIPHSTLKIIRHSKFKKNIEMEKKKQEKRRYVAPGLIDFNLMLHAGEAWTIVRFSGGRTSGLNNLWAHYTTDDEVIQHLIENSPEFRQGRVTIDYIAEEE